MYIYIYIYVCYLGLGRVLALRGLLLKLHGVLDDLLDHAHDRGGAGVVLLLVELHRRGLLHLGERGLAHALHVEVLELLEGLNII